MRLVVGLLAGAVVGAAAVTLLRPGGRSGDPAPLPAPAPGGPARVTVDVSGAPAPPP